MVGLRVFVYKQVWITTLIEDTVTPCYVMSGVYIIVDACRISMRRGHAQKTSANAFTAGNHVPIYDMKKFKK